MIRRSMIAALAALAALAGASSRMFSAQSQPPAGISAATERVEAATNQLDRINIYASRDDQAVLDEYMLAVNDLLRALRD